MKLFSKWLEHVTSSDTSWSLNGNSLDIFLKDHKITIPLNPDQIQEIQKLVDSFQRPPVYR